MFLFSTPWSDHRLRILCVLVAGISSALLAGCTPVLAESQDCVHGLLDASAKCVCEPCWTGDSCDQYAKRKPIFFQKSAEVYLSSEHENGEPIYTAEAVDMDETYSCQVKTPCPCAKIHYSIISGNEDLDFRIDSETGAITLTGDALPIKNREYVLEVSAENPGSDEYDVLKLTIHVPVSWDDNISNRYLVDNLGDGYMEPHHIHSIHKRLVYTPPGNVTFELNKTGVSENITEMRVGTRVSFQLQILFPSMPTDMLVELFAPDNDSIVMMLCNVTVKSVGSALLYTGSGVPVMDSANGSTTLFDRAVIDFGNVTYKTGVTPAASADISIYITWDAVMIDNVQTQNSTVYWVSAGAEYNYENEVWVGQASFTAITTPELSTNFSLPTFNLSGPDTMEIGSSAVFTLNVYLPLPSVYLNINAFAPLNTSDVMSVCGMKVKDTGSNFVCGFLPSEHSAKMYPDSNTRGNGRARLELGTLTNKGAREISNPTENNRITVEFVVHLYEDPTYVGRSYGVGAAVEIGKSQIWAGEISVTAVARDTSRIVSPTVTLTKVDNQAVSTLKPVVVNVDIKLPRNSSAKYAFEALTPVINNETVLQLCAVTVSAYGENVPCTDTDVTPSYYHRGNLPMYVDRVYADLGVITNVGSWGWQKANTSNVTFDPDTVRLRMLVKATNHSLATAGSSHNVSLGLFINDDRLLVTSFVVQVEADATVPNITNDASPDWGLNWAYGSGNVQVGSAAQVLLSITAKRNIVYSPFDIEAIMPNSSGSTMVSVCKLRAYSVGKNLPCAIKESLNSSVYYTSDSTVDYLYNRAVINLPSLCDYETVNSTAEDKLVLEVSFRLEKNASLANGTELWPSVGIMFSPYKMWIGQIKMWARTDLRVASGVAPYISVFKSDSSGVPIGYYAFYTVLIKSVPGDTVPIVLNVSTSAVGYGVCSVRVVQVGNNMPCTNVTNLVAVYERNTDGLNNKATLDFGSVSNTATGNKTDNNTFDDNSILAQVIISVPPTAISGSTSSFSVVLQYGGTPYFPTVPAFNITSNTSVITKKAYNVTDFQFAVIPITDTDNSTNVVLGQVKRFQLCTRTLPASATALGFQLVGASSTSQHLETTYIGLLSGGKNLPCYTGPCGKTTATYGKSVPSFLYNDLATLDLGYVYNTGFDVADDSNKVCADGMVRVLKDSGLLPGNKVSVNASVTVNGQLLASQLLELTVLDNTTFSDIYRANTSLINGSVIDINSTFPNPLRMRPGDVATIPLVLSIPPYVTSVVTMDAKMEANVSACMTISGARIVAVGRNLNGFGKSYDLTCTTNSSLGTTQMDMAVCDLGIVTNPGSSYTCGSVLTNDNSIIVEVDVRLADCLVTTNNTSLMASFGLKVAGFIAIGDHTVIVTRNGLEQPVFNVTAAANATGDVIYLNFNIRLDNTSSAELYNASLLLYPPPYVNCSKVASSAGTNGVPVLTAGSKQTTVGLGNIYFTDAITLLVTCDVLTTYTVPTGITGYHTVLPYHVYGDVVPRTPTLLNSTTFFSDLAYVNFTATTTSTVTCTSGAMGMSDANTIKDCQITSSYESVTSVLDARKGGSGWQPFVRDGDLLAQRYLQVYFGNKVIVSEVEVGQNGPTISTRLKLSYSDDGISFVDGSEIALGGSTTTRAIVSQPRESRILRVYITADNSTDQSPSLTFEFYGCATTADITDPCQTAPAAPTTDPLYFRRSFLSVDTSVFVCDGIVEAKGVQQRCFASPDATVWQPLDSRLGSMVGHDPDGARVYALANDGVTYMSSGDNGLTWATTQREDYEAARAKATAFRAAINVPWTRTVASGDPALSYQQGNWGAAFDGLKQNSGVWKTKVKWSCC